MWRLRVTKKCGWTTKDSEAGQVNQRVCRRHGRKAPGSPQRCTRSQNWSRESANQLLARDWGKNKLDRDHHQTNGPFYWLFPSCSFSSSWPLYRLTGSFIIFRYYSCHVLLDVKTGEKTQLVAQLQYQTWPTKVRMRPALGSPDTAKCDTFSHFLQKVQKES